MGGNAHCAVLSGQTATTTVGFLRRALAWFAAHDITV